MRISRGKKPVSKTKDPLIDWPRIRKMSDAAIRRSIAENPDAAPDMTDELKTPGRFRRIVGAMRARELVGWRERNRLTQEAAGAALGLTKRAIQKYEAGQDPIPRTVALACAAVELDGEFAAAASEKRRLDPKTLRHRIAVLTGSAE